MRLPRIERKLPRPEPPDMYAPRHAADYRAPPDPRKLPFAPGRSDLYSARVRIGRPDPPADRHAWATHAARPNLPDERSRHHPPPFPPPPPPPTPSPPP